MKAKFLILILFFSIGIGFSQQQSPKKLINLKAHVQDSSTYVKAKGLNIDTMSIDEIIKTVVAVKNQANALKDSVNKQAITINGLKIVKPDVNSGMPSWVEYFLGLLAIIIVWALSFIKSLGTSKIAILKRLGMEASNFVKRIQAVCGSISEIIPTLLATTKLPATLTFDLNIIEFIALSITLFACFLVKDSTKLVTPAQPVIEPAK